MVIQLIKKLNAIYETENSMPCSQAPSSDPVVSQMNAVHILTPVP
jgi:hypothetical protein